MAKSMSAGEVEFEYLVPFWIPEAKTHNTLVLPLDDKRYVVDSMGKQILVGRVSREGQADETFNSIGFRAEDIPGLEGGPQAAGLIPQQDGLVIGGLHSEVDLGLVRFKTDGNVDLTFGEDGRIVHKVNQGAGRAAEDSENKKFSASTSAALTPAKDGKFYAMLGQRFRYNSTLLRCLPDGGLDTSFYGNGKIAVKHPDFIDHTDACAVVSTEDGGAVVAGTLGGRAVGMRGFFCRFKANGLLDDEFGEKGYAIFDSASAGIPAPDLFQMEFNYVVDLADGGYAACGYISTKNSSRNYGLLVCVNASGRPATSFNGGKPLLFELPDGAEADFLFGGIAEQDNGKLVVAGGSVTRSSGFQRHVLVARFLADGKLDTAFGGKGWITHQPLGNTVNFVYCIAVDDQQNILISGDGGNSDAAGDLKGFVVQFKGV